jgi:hypothetical protein
MEAVQAAGAQEVRAAEIHILGLIRDAATPKTLLLAAIEAVAGVAPSDAKRILGTLLDSDDEDIADAAEEAIASALAQETSEDFDEEDEDDEDDEDGPAWVN